MKPNRVSMEMKFNRLKEIAKELNIEFNPIGLKKEGLVKMINDEYKNQEEAQQQEVEAQQAEEAKEVEEAVNGKKNKNKKGTESARATKRAEKEKIVSTLLLDEEVKKHIAEAKTKADAIRALLNMGIERKYIAKVMNVRYQMVYQVQQRMLANERVKQLRDEARRHIDIIKNMDRKKAEEEFGEDLLTAYDKIVAEEAKKSEQE